MIGKAEMQAVAFGLIGTLCVWTWSASPSAVVAQRDADALEREVSLQALLDRALRQGPDLLEQQERVAASQHRVAPARRLPDPELKYELWGVPLGRPFALGRSDTIMLGVRQEFPAPGSLDAQGRMAKADAAIAGEALRQLRLDRLAQVKRAYYAYYQADREGQLQAAQAELLRQSLELARSRFGAALGSAQEIARAELELADAARERLASAQQRASSAAWLNSMLGRPPDAALGPPAEFELIEHVGDFRQLAAVAQQQRPELAASRHAVARSEALLSQTRSEARLPKFMFGADYWYMPREHSPHGYGAMASLSLPWLNPRHGELLQAAERERGAELRAQDAQRVHLSYEVYDAWTRARAALSAWQLVKNELLPAAQRNAQAAQAAFGASSGAAAAWLEASRGVLQVRMRELQARVDLAAAQAQLARAVGEPAVSSSSAARGVMQ